MTTTTNAGSLPLSSTNELHVMIGKWFPSVSELHSITVVSVHKHMSTNNWSCRVHECLFCGKELKHAPRSLYVHAKLVAVLHGGNEHNIKCNKI